VPDMSNPEPLAVIEARAGVAETQKRLVVYLSGIAAGVLAILGTAAADVGQGVVLSTVALYVVWCIAGSMMLKASKTQGHQHVIKEWETRALREEFAEFDRAAGKTFVEDPRLDAAAGMAERIRALQASDPGTDDMVTRLEARLARLVTDQAAAATAVQALEAAGAGGSGRLADAAHRLEDEIARILSGMSDLYAALLDAESGAAGDPTADLGEVMAWLSAEAEIARAAQEAEAMRPAKGGAAASKQSVSG
jgi:hypothetical protein